MDIDKVFDFCKAKKRLIKRNAKFIIKQQQQQQQEDTDWGESLIESYIDSIAEIVDLNGIPEDDKYIILQEAFNIFFVFSDVRKAMLIQFPFHIRDWPRYKKQVIDWVNANMEDTHVRWKVVGATEDVEGEHGVLVYNENDVSEADLKMLEEYDNDYEDTLARVLGMECGYFPRGGNITIKITSISEDSNDDVVLFEETCKDEIVNEGRLQDLVDKINDLPLFKNSDVDAKLSIETQN